MKNGIAYKKLLLIGDSKVGKTCFIKKMQYGNFIAEYAKTESIFSLVESLQFSVLRWI